MTIKTLFTERQRFNQTWLWVILFAINGFFLFLAVRFVWVYDEINIGLFIGVAINITIAILFYCLRLDTIITEEGISIRFFPFHLSVKKFAWSNLTKSYVKQYSPIADFGGWGLRYAFSGQGKAYNVSGNMGLQIILADGQKILIGTNKPEEITKILNEMNQWRE
jgi:hypothetical protein